MRDSELQALRRDAFDISAVIPSVKSMTYKAQGVNGKARSWWVPSVVHTAVDVLEQLSLTERLFSRSGKTGEGGEEGARVTSRASSPSSTPRQTSVLDGGPWVSTHHSALTRRHQCDVPAAERSMPPRTPERRSAWVFNWAKHRTGRQADTSETRTTRRRKRSRM